MIKANEAVQIARDQMHAWFGDELHALELEEVEISEDKRAWLVTLGYSVKRSNPTASELMSAPVGAIPDSIRAYKLFTIDAESGEVRSMKSPKS
ncbi:MAG: hypothetical protein GWN29_00570 [Gammaproteobacteria bacterium]|nr:hypothetical protein [Gammaproteobacteria bacterium]